MDAALAVAKTGLEAQQNKLRTHTNNLANMNTAGYKASRSVFEDLLYQVVRQPGASANATAVLPTGVQLGTGVRLVATERIFTQGSFSQTGRDLDIAIQGKGFFEVTQADGTSAYTRNGKFTVDDSGQIVTAQGLVLSPAITIPEDALSVTISEDGIVSVSQQGATATTQVGTITLATFINPAGLQAVGGNLYKETASSGTATTGNPGAGGVGTIAQGMIEESNVNPVEELVGLIETQKAYEMNSKGIDTSQQMTRSLTQIA